MASSRDSTLGDSLIPVINRLQDIFSQVTVDLKLSLPQVAVVGSQSSGKSSVLESLVGRDFLPRGSDIVTRRPLVLQLVKSNSTSNGMTEWGEFLHVPGKLFYEFDKIRQEIQAETDRVVGTNKNVSDKPIRLKVFSPHVLTMTLVDLPGMTKVPVGDQPSNIEARIRDMVLDHIRSPSVIILAVSPANADLANSDAIQLARMVDPDGLRTIGVLTKLDIMDRGTSAAHILRNTHIPLRLGYVAVVNRSQEDINQAKSIPDARRAEDRFFSSKPEYRDVLSHCGVTQLARRLNLLLVDHIRVLLPGLRRAIAEQLESRAAELRALGAPLPVESKSAKGAYLLQLLCEYSERFAAMLEGRHQDLSTQRLSGGARIRAVFNTMFGPTLRDLAPHRDVSDEAILTVIKNGAGVAGNLLVPQEPFELLVRKSVAALLPPCLSCKEGVHQELLHIAEQACPREAIRFPGLQRALAGAVVDFITGNAEPAERMIRELVDCEHDFINCDHPDFIGGRGAIRAVMQERSLRAAQGVAGRAKDSGDGLASKDSGSGLSAQGSRTSKAHAGAADSSKAALAGPGPAGHTFAAGLKGIPESAAFSSDELLTRTRRRSDDGGPGLLGTDNAMVLGTGQPAPGMSAPLPGYSTSSAAAPMHGYVSPPHSRHTPPPQQQQQQQQSSFSGSGQQGNGPASASSSSSWFSWFGRHSESRAGEDGVLSGAAGRGGGPGSYGLSQGAGRGPNGGPGSSPGLSSLNGAFSLVRTEQEEVEVEVIRRLVDSYFGIVKRNLSDAVPKAVMHFMVNNTKRGLQTHLIQHMYKDDLLEELLGEREEVVTQRKTAQEALAALQSANKALSELPNELGSAAGVAVSGSQTMAFDDATLGGASLFGQNASLDRHQSMAHAARIASAATASLTGHNEAAMTSSGLIVMS
ncbi:hypothetical protein QJQ45_022772 [Haematococcus lacustris]|nr:hypothetical protein QJQ45_022772 [Haematococcus lacustris]